MKEGEGGRYLFLTFYKIILTYSYSTEAREHEDNDNVCVMLLSSWLWRIILTYSYSTEARVHEDNDNVCLMLLSSWLWRSSEMILLPFQDAS